MELPPLYFLKPCPFCGGPARLERAHIERDRTYGERQFWGVVCRNTANRGGSCCMDQVPSASQEAAIARWNMRAYTDAAIAAAVAEERAKWMPAARRYEIVRRMSVPAFQDAFVLNRRTGKPFDEIIDELAPFYLTAAT